jgi:hypothetical protein
MDQTLEIAARLAEPIQAHGRTASLRITLPPLAVVIFKP